MDTPLSFSQARELVLGGVDAEVAEHLMRPDLTDCPTCHVEDLAPESLLDCEADDCRQRGSYGCVAICPAACLNAFPLVSSQPDRTITSRRIIHIFIGCHLIIPF